MLQAAENGGLDFSPTAYPETRSGNIIGGWWKSLILRHIYYGLHRFDILRCCLLREPVKDCPGVFWLTIFLG